MILGLSLMSVYSRSEEKAGVYSPVGKRDPFRPQALESTTEREPASAGALERYSVEQFQLRGILRRDGKSNAMFEDPEGQTHIVLEGQSMGRERATVSRILNSEVILTEKTFNYLGAESLYEKVISLPTK